VEYGQKSQDLYLPRPVTSLRFNHDASTLLVASDKALFCWKYNEQHKEYALTWKNGDVLLASETNFKGIN